MAVEIPPTNPSLPRYVQSVNGIRPNIEGDVVLPNYPTQPPTNPAPDQKVLVLSPEEEIPDVSSFAEGTLVVRLKDNSATTAVKSASNVVILDPLDPEPAASTLPKNTLVLRLVEAN